MDMQDKIVQQVITAFKARSELGIKKYNTTLEDSTESLAAFLKHAQEEAMDFVLYLEKIKSLINQNKQTNEKST